VLVKPISTRDPFRVGIVALVVGGLLGAGILFFSVASFGTTTYTAVLEHTAGLRATESVEVYGVDSGKVTDVELRDTDVLVTFELDSDIELGDETSAEVKVATLLGTHYLQVTPAGGGDLADNRIPLERTGVPYNLQDVIEEGTQALGELDPVLLARALTEASTTLDASREEIGPALEGIGMLSEVVQSRAGQTEQLLDLTREVTGQLSDSSGDLVTLMEQANLVIEEITGRREAIRLLLTEARELLDALTDVVERTEDDLAPTVRDLELTLETLNREDRTLRRLLDVLQPTARYLANASGSGPWLDLYGENPALFTDQMRCLTTGGC
jgi:phospholipid/cholesterol/gamma-HCH transport system substrate-binding protein